MTRDAPRGMSGREWGDPRDYLPIFDTGIRYIFSAAERAELIAARDELAAGRVPDGMSDLMAMAISALAERARSR